MGAVVSVAVALAGAPGSASASSWSTPAAIGPGIIPIVQFGPTGEAAVVSNQNDPFAGAGGGGSAYVVLRAPGAAFSAPQTVSPPSYQDGTQPNVDGVAVTSTGTVVLEFDSLAQGGTLPVTTMVEPSGASGFGPAQQLIGPGAEEANTPIGLVAATARGEAVFVGSDLSGDVAAAALAPGGTGFLAGPALPALSATGVGPQLLTVDGAGGAFASAVGACIRLAYRPPGGRFKNTYNYCPRAFNATVDGLAAAGQTIAAGIRSPKVKTSGWVADRGVAVLRCVRGRPCTLSASVAARGKRFGAPQVIARGAAPLQFLGDGRGDLLLVYSDRHGAVDAVSRSPRAVRFSAPVQLAPPGTETATVTGAFGPDGEAIVAWSHAGTTYAAVYHR